MNIKVLLTLSFVVSSLIVGTIFVVAQQIERRGADDAGWRLASQVRDELARSVASGVDGGRSLTLSALPQVTLETSLAPFVVVFDAENVPVAGNGYLDGALATVPDGVLETARMAGSNEVSWEPEPGLRFATVELKAGDTVVLAGQSLEPSEARTDFIGILLLTAWLGLSMVGALGLLLSWRVGPQRRVTTGRLGNR